MAFALKLPNQTYIVAKRKITHSRGQHKQKQQYPDIIWKPHTQTLKHYDKGKIKKYEVHSLRIKAIHLPKELKNTKINIILKKHDTTTPLNSQQKNQIETNLTILKHKITTIKNINELTKKDRQKIFQLIDQTTKQIIQKLQ